MGGKDRKILRLDDGVFLNKDWTMKGKCKCDAVHRTKEEEMRCSVRDKSNAGIFADYIKRVRGGEDPVGFKITEPKIGLYLDNNKKTKVEDRRKSFEGFMASVKVFAGKSESFWYSQ